MTESRLFRLLLTVWLFGTVACTQGAESPLHTPDPEVSAVLAGWMGQFSRREPALAELLEGNPGWGHLRDMSLFEAVQSFEGGGRATDRIGAARAYLALAELCASLDRVLIEAEGVYLAAKGEPVSPARRARRLVVHLRAGDFEATRAGLAAGAPQEFSFTWQLVGGILEGPDGDHADTVQPGGEGERLLGAVAAYLWGLPPSRGGSSPYDHALTALRRGDLVGGVLSLQLLEFAPGAEGPGPELFLYELLRRTFAGLAIAAIGDAGAPEANYLLAVAHGHLGRSDAARDLFRRAAQATGEFSLAALLFSPYTDAAEQRALARIHGGEVATAEGGPLQLLAVARTEGEVIAALERMQLAPGGFPADATDLAGLYGARRAAGARQAARVLWQVSADRQAMDVLERAHRKSSGYRPDFVNPPAFLADLARAHQRLGEYAPAVAALFELAAEYPSARVAYESLKRLYASRAGGEVPPR